MVFLFGVVVVVLSLNTAVHGSLPGLMAPGDITADPGKERVTLNWSLVPGALSYNVYYSSKPGVTKDNAADKIENQHAPYIQRSLKNGSAYFFRVAAVDERGEGLLSKEVSAVPSAAPPPPAPVGVTLSPGPGWIRVSWLPSAGAASYDLYYDKKPGVTPGSGRKVARTKSGRYVAPLENGIRHYFIVVASNANGQSPPSFEKTAVPAATIPAAPEGLVAQEGDRQVALTWKPVPGAASYTIYSAAEMSLSKNTGSKIANVTDNRHVVRGLNNGRAYHFVVTSVNASGESGESLCVGATPLAVRPAPTMVRIPGGGFLMGDNLDGIPYATPARMVQLDDFYIDKYETTYSLWKEVYDWAVAHGYAFDNGGANGSTGNGTNLPVTTVSWYDAVKWLNARSEKEGKTPVYCEDAARTVVYRKGRVDIQNAAVRWDDNGYRLPTEAEWEKAARGGLTGKRYPWGDDLGRGNGNDNMGGAVSVATYPPNGYGLHDMAGNVFEWVWNWGSAKEGYDWGSLGSTNPRGPDSSEENTRVRRGGGYTYGSRYLKCCERMFRMPTYTSSYFGFRSASSKP